MEISDMQIFMAVAREGSISRAAEQLGYVQSNVTARIRMLEKEIGTPLFQRHRRGMTLNPEGRKLLVYAERMTLLMNEMHKAFQDPDDPAGTLMIGSVETVVGLPDILNRFYRRYSNVDISLVTGVTPSLTEEVQLLKLDGAFVSGPVDIPNIEQHPVFEEELVLVCSTSREELFDDNQIKELLQLPLLVFRSGCGYRARLEKWMQSEGVTPNKIMEFGTLETIIGTVVAGLGITLVPRRAVYKLEREGLVKLFQIPEILRKVSVVYIRRSDSYLGEVERRFLETISEVREERIVHQFE